MHGFITKELSPKKLKGILVLEEMLSLFGYLLNLWAICGQFVTI
jgi:hypothetical protein